MTEAAEQYSLNKLMLLIGWIALGAALLRTPYFVLGVMLAAVVAGGVQFLSDAWWNGRIPLWFHWSLLTGTALSIAVLAAI